MLTLPALRFQDLGDFRFCDKPVANQAEIFGNGVLTVALKIRKAVQAPARKGTACELKLHKIQFPVAYEYNTEVLMNSALQSPH